MVDGTLQRWRNPIEGDKDATVKRVGGSKTSTVPPSNDLREIGDGPEDLDIDDENWMIDDLDGAFRDEPKSKEDMFAREMGKFIIIQSLTSLVLNLLQ
jgi:hypothetical protein